MEIDLMTGSSSWKDAAALARELEQAGFSGMLYTETSQVPWMQITAAATAAPNLFFTTGIAVAFPRSPMVSAAVAYEMAGNLDGKFRLGLGSQVKAHVTRRYSAEFEHPAARLKDYVGAVKACFRAFNGEERLSYEGKFYNLSLLPKDWAPPRHNHEMKVDISAVGPLMVRVAGEVADGIHVHPLHSLPYLENRLTPQIKEGTQRAGRSVEDIDLIIPVFAAPGDTPEERELLVQRARQQIAFYGSTPNYAFQFDDLGFDGTTSRIREKMKAGDIAGMTDLITDEMLEQFAVIAPWDDLADRLVERYSGQAARVVMYLTEASLKHDPNNIGKWGEIARAVRAA